MYFIFVILAAAYLISTTNPELIPQFYHSSLPFLKQTDKETSKQETYPRNLIQNFPNTNLLIEEIPLIQKKKSLEEIKKSLDDFVMVRKKTHITIPNLRNIDHNKARDNFKRLKRESDSIDDLKDITKNATEEIEEAELSEIKNYVNLPLDLSNFNENQLEALRTQAERMNDLIRRIQGENYRKSIYSDFENLLMGIEERNQRLKTAKTTTTQPSKKQSTVELIIDQAMVKEALKKDPYVNRILSLVNMKRKENLQG